MKRLVLSISFVLAAFTLMLQDLMAQDVKAQDSNEFVLEQQPFRVYSAFWQNLHNVLWAEAWARRPPSASEPSPAGSLPEPLTRALTPEEKAAWDAAISYYDREIADLHLLFEMGKIRKALLVTGDLPSKGLASAHRQVLTRAAPVYRKYWWSAHDRANRAWIKDTFSNVASLSPAVPDRLARLYGTPWFERALRVDVVPVSMREGAFTSREPAPGHITISSGNTNLVGWMGAEIVFHESSHLLVFPMIKAFDAELRAQRKKAPDLWHVALFYLTGEVVRQALASRDIAYESYPYKTGLFDRAWPQFKAPVETHWKAYVNGEMSQGDAIKKIVAAIK